MKPLLDVLVILDALDKEGSFAAASAKLYKTPSALSYTIHKLESDLNIQLLDRSGHRARFTRTGQMLLEKGRDVLHTARELEKQAIKLHQGWENALVLAVDNTFPFSLLAPLLMAFYQQHPAISLEFRRDNTSAGWQPLTEGRADLLLGALSDPPALSGYGFASLGALAQAFVASSRHPLAQHTKPLGWRMLRRHRVIVTDSPWLQGENQERLTVPDLPDQLMLLCAGLGWSYLPLFQVRDLLDSGELQILNTAIPEPLNRAWIGWNEHACGLAGEWWRNEILANSAIRQVYNTKIV
ncbi:LysR family transcriptional regulator [Klebsiella spallanzanii]|uniref:LysR family transcriptional regulator n=1 Tax=Klebsiella spallanzanii TaxID=2587528 RepID=UPI00115A4BA8|nr:LysR substrate-binding domain-containing protein [Klebsiella spallanzanii]VUS73721.1 HTH-type transcriptional regulator YhaJ [Klebsiella spallanzanii]